MPDPVIDSECSVYDESTDQSDSNDHATDDLIIQASQYDIEQCNIVNWYNRFKRYTIPSRFIDISGDVVDYILSDSINIPQNLLKIHHNNQIHVDVDTDSDNGISGDDNSNAHDDVLNDLLSPFAISVSECINELGGTVCPQLNYNTPSDAVWISTDKSLRCATCGDILLLLKSSDLIAAELSDDSLSHQLVLRKWSTLHPAKLLRCFVKDNTLIAVSQIDTEYHEYLNHTQTKSHFLNLINTFFLNTIKQQFDLHNYIFDAYCDTNDRVWIIKFKPWSSSTSSCLYSWDELVNYNASDVISTELRVVERSGQNYYDVSVRGTAQKMMSRLPYIDNIDLSDTAAIERFAATVQMQ